MPQIRGALDAQAACEMMLHCEQRTAVFLMLCEQTPQVMAEREQCYMSNTFEGQGGRNLTFTECRLDKRVLALTALQRPQGCVR